MPPLLAPIEWTDGGHSDPANASPAATHSRLQRTGSSSTEQDERTMPFAAQSQTQRSSATGDGRLLAKAPAPRLATGAPMRADKAVRQPERPMERRSDVVGDWSGPAGGGRHLSSFIGASRCAATEGAPRRPWPVGRRERSRRRRTLVCPNAADGQLRPDSRRSPSSHTASTVLVRRPTGRLTHAGRTKDSAGRATMSRVARYANKQH